MNRKVLMVAIVGVGLVGVVGVLEYTGRLGQRSATGAAVGVESGGCAGNTLAELPAEPPANIIEGDMFNRAMTAKAGPDNMFTDVVKGEFLVGFTEDANNKMVLGDNLVTFPSVELNKAFNDVGFSGFKRLHADLPKKDLPLGPFGIDRSYRFSSTKDLDTTIATISAIPGVQWVEPVVKIHAFQDGQERPAPPDDPFYAYQWNMTTLNMMRAWRSSDAGKDIVVAVLDSGLSLGEDGIMHTRLGYDFVDFDEDPADENGHGTHVAGTIAQRTNNGIGVIGAAPGAHILPVRVLGADGSGDSAALAGAILYAVDHDAKVINMSLGSSSPSTAVEEACAFAYEAGVLLVAAAGNDGYTDFISYPAAYPWVMAVGATDLNGDRAAYSNQGRELEVMAPGGDLSVDSDGDGLPDGILQETIHDGEFFYVLAEGTSMAAPHVSALGAMMYSSGMTDVVDIRRAIRLTSLDLGAPGPDSSYGQGIINPPAAVAWHAPREKAQELVLDQILVENLENNAVLISWITDIAASTKLSDESGYTYLDVHPLITHRAFAGGEAGATVVYTITSRTPDNSYFGTTTVEVTFPD